MIDIRNKKGYKEVLEFYNGDYLAADVWSKKYGYIEYIDTIIEPYEAWKIIAKELASVQNYIIEEDILDVLEGWQFVPAGRILHGILRHHFAKKYNDKLNIGLSNCMYMGGPEDSIESIMDYAKLHAIILKHGYGNGLNLNKLRPNGSKVSNAAITSAGVVPFMKLFSEITNTIGHAGRRGASIITLDVSHPDVKEFILAKTHNENDITGANISVMVDNKFMKAVENNEEYELRFEFNDNRNPITKKVNARELFNLIAEAAWDWGEPGLLFKDTIQNETSLNFSEYTLPTGVNPCVTGDTLINTKDGAIRIDELAKEGKDVLVWSVNKDNGNIELKMGRKPRLTRKDVDTLKILFEDDSEFKCTYDHKVLLYDLTEIEAKELKIGDILFITNNNKLIKLKIKEIKDNGKHNVYNITVDDNHTYGIILRNDNFINCLYTANCGEVTMSSFTRCCLGSVMLEKFAISESTHPTDNFELKKVVKNGVKILNAVTDYELYYNLFPKDIPQIKEQAKYFRQIGLGISGLADYLGLRGFGYNFNEDTKYHLEQLFKSISYWAYEASIEVANHKGHNIISNTVEYMFNKKIIKENEKEKIYKELLDKYVNSNYIKRLNKDNSIMIGSDKNIPINSAILSIAPTGSLSIVAGGMYDYGTCKMNYTQCSSGIEPVIFRKYKRTTKIHGKDEVYDVEHWSIKIMKEINPDITEDEIKRMLPTIHEVDPSDKVKIQGLIQKYIDNSISSTINLPNKYTKHDVLKLYMDAWKFGCKGITVFRDGCKRMGIIVESKDENDKKDEEILNKEYTRPTRLYGFTEKIKFHDAPAFITMNMDEDGNPKEFFMNISKSGELLGAMSEAMGRLISLSLYYHIPIQEIIKQLEDISGGDPIWHKFEENKKPIMIKSIPDAVAKLLRYYLNNLNQKNIVNNDKVKNDIEDNIRLKCPKCGEKTLVKSEGCMLCTNCGYSKCG